MTVCVAALCKTSDKNWAVIGASDRMLTDADEVQFEPELAKIYNFTNCVKAMLAGDASAQIQLCYLTALDVRQRLARDQSWLGVGEVAKFYAKNVGILTNQGWETERLTPLGLNTEKVLENGISPDVAGPLVHALHEHRPSVQVLIVGKDLEGAHIYSVTGHGEIQCHDSVGFAAIGIGRRQAESQFMLAKHNFMKPFAETLFLTYMAKRKSEIVAGVGIATDMIVIHELGTFASVNAEELKRLEEVYNRLITAQQAATDSAVQEVRKWVDETLRAQQAAQSKQTQATPPTSQSPPEAPPNHEPPTDVH